MIREGMNVLRQNENGYKIGDESLRLVLIRISLGRLVCLYVQVPGEQPRDLYNNLECSGPRNVLRYSRIFSNVPDFLQLSLYYKKYLLSSYMKIGYLNGWVFDYLVLQILKEWYLKICFLFKFGGLESKLIRVRLCLETTY